jgi:glycosyltransferase involved in cell wall biosynthesis
VHFVKRLSILGCRGIPGNHGGFETFAERLSRYLINHGWEVTVYCEDYAGIQISETYWNGVRLIHIPVPSSSASATVLFDWKSTLYAAREGNLILTLGYNTALFCGWYRLKGLVNVINMDGLEWRRQKWSAPEKAWLYLNERLGCWFGNHLVADHPEIADHLATRVSRRKITMIPYGADRVGRADASLLSPYDLSPGSYSIVIARPEPENNILEIVLAFSSRPRGSRLVVLGNYLTKKSAYHRQVLAAASDEVMFPGAIYDQSTVAALRYYAALYVHGHSVGGTNPSLVEAMGAGASVLAHDNRFNRWVAGPGAHYFSNAADCAVFFDRLLADTEELRLMKQASRQRFKEGFSAEVECQAYEALLERALDGNLSGSAAKRKGLRKPVSAGASHRNLSKTALNVITSFRR